MRDGGAVVSYAVLRAAIAKRRQVVCIYDGCVRAVCPHVIGRKQGRAHVLVFQFAGDSNSGLPPGGEWRCMAVADIRDVHVLDGPWHTAPHSQPQSCVDQVDLEV
jgi:hypothetical protein